MKTQLRIVGSIAAVAALIAYLIMMGVHYMSPEPSHFAEAFAKANNTPAAWVVHDAKICNGIFSKLDPDERQKLTAQYKGQAPEVIAVVYASSRD